MFLNCSQEIGNTIHGNSSKTSEPDGLLLVKGQLSAPQSIKSIQLYRKGFTGNPPIIRLGSSDRLVLEFDELTNISGQFRISFSHHNSDWQESGLPDPWTYDGINELFLRGGEINRFSKPEYFNYKTEFPNREIKFLVSGNYLLHVFDYQSGTELFSLPFFVTENEGEFLIKSETLFNQGQDGSAKDQLFGEFSYPEFIEFPQFNLSYIFVQNRFWKDTRKATETSFTKEGLTEFHISRSNSFAASFDFSFLNLSPLSLQNPQIYNFEPTKIPPKVILKDDNLNFLGDSRPSLDSKWGLPKSSRDDQYASVHFRINTGGRFKENSSIYLLGSFNQWQPSDRYKMNLNSDLNVLETSVLLKEGAYPYKYVLKEGGTLNTLILNDSITKQDQEYLGFIYYKDPDYQYDRLLNTKLIQSLY